MNISEELKEEEDASLKIKVGNDDSYWETLSESRNDSITSNLFQTFTTDSIDIDEYDSYRAPTEDLIARI